MLKHARLYKDASGQVWHIKSDGTAIKYPQFEVYPEAPKGAYEEILPEVDIEMADNLYLAEATASHVLVAPSYLCVVSKDVERRKQDDVHELFNVIDCTWQIAVTACDYEYKLFPVANLKKGTKYMVKGRPAIFQCYLNSCDSFMFTYDDSDNPEYVKVAQICDVKEVDKMPKMFEIWKEDNGETKGRDCKTGREFTISENVFGYVERYSKEPRTGDTVYIHSPQGIRPTEAVFVRRAAEMLADNNVMLYYAYRNKPSSGYTAYLMTQKPKWIVEYAAPGGNMRLVIDKDCLTICPPKSDYEGD